MFKRITIVGGLIILIFTVLGCFGGNNSPVPITHNFNPNFPISLDSGPDAVNGKPGISFDGTNFICVWQKGSDIYCTRVTSNGTVIDNNGIPISVGLNESTYPPSVAFDGTNYFVVWAATRSGISEIYGARVTSQGVVLDPGGIKITDGGDPLIRMPSIIFDGTNYFVVWRTNSSNIYGAHISTNGIILGNKQGFPIINNGCSYYPSVGFDGTNYMVVWHQGSYGNLKVYGARVDKNENVLDPGGFVICDDPQDKEYAMIAFDGTNYLVVWYDWRPNNSKMFGSCYGTRVTPSGMVLDKPAFKIADQVRGEVAIPVIFDGTNYLVTWMMESPNEMATNARLTDVYGKFVSKEGQVSHQAIPFSTSFWHQFGPILGYGGNRYFAAWCDRRGDTTGMNAGIYGQIFSKDELGQNQPFHESIATSGGWTQTIYGFSQYGSDGLAFSGDNAYVFDYGAIVHLSGGQWHFENSFPEGCVYASWADSLNNIWVGGWACGVNHFDGSKWSDLGALGMTGQIITGIWGTNNQNIWFSTDNGHLFHYNGSNCFQIFINVPFDLEDIWGSSSNNIYAIGERGTIIHYNGSDWQLINGIPTIQTLNAIWGSGPNDIFVVGDWGTILHFNGSAWSFQETCTDNHLYDVWGFGSNDVYAVGLEGTILHFDGSSWQAIDSGINQDLLSVFGFFNTQTNTHTVLVTGSGNIILKKEY